MDFRIQQIFPSETTKLPNKIVYQSFVFHQLSQHQPPGLISKHTETSPSIVGAPWEGDPVAADELALF